jgi:hypothetical protein
MRYPANFAGFLQGAQDTNLGNVQAIDSNEESDVDGSGLIKNCLARQMLLYRREGRIHGRNVQ